MTLPADPGTGAPTWLVEVPLAHRGLHGDGIPENSMAAFRAAADAGYGVELDVHVTSDDLAVVAHDASLLRMAGVDRRIGEMTGDELQGFRLEETDEHIPRLPEALEALRDVPVMVELKSPRLRAGALERRVAALLDEHPGPVCVASFNPVALRWFRRNRPDLPRVLTATSESSSGLPAPLVRRLANLRDLRSVDPVAVSYDVKGLPQPAVDQWRDRGGAVVTWTVHDEATWETARRHADNIIFENIRPSLDDRPTT